VLLSPPVHHEGVQERLIMADFFNDLSESTLSHSTEREKLPKAEGAVQCRMALIKDSLWKIVIKMNGDPGEAQAEAHSNWHVGTEHWRSFCR